MDRKEQAKKGKTGNWQAVQAQAGQAQAGNGSTAGMNKNASLGNESTAQFWAEHYADTIVKRENYHYLDKKIPKLKKWSVKSSSSLSGVLHIGRLSDIIRGEAVYLALKEKGFPADFIYVMEDMDPLRKVPKGIPESYLQYIGFPVSDIPDPEKCHKSYAEHFITEFMESFSSFLVSKPKIYSMREEYKKGSFNDSIKILIENTKKVKEIIDSKKEAPTPEPWSPWKPICDRCGSLQTTAVTGIEGNKVKYICKDYKFEQNTAKGCGYEGESSISKANGKLVWKSEWAAQWKRWSVATEGAGKEYNAPNTAFFVNAEICEKILDFPMPEPIFYEHIFIGGEKMSASLGNVIYPKDWIEVARPEALKYLYMKRIDKARNFSWLDVPNLELELDRLAESNSIKGKAKGKEAEQDKKLYKYSHVKGRTILPMPLDYSFASAISQLFPDKKSLLKVLKETGSLPKGKAAMSQINERIEKARKWAEKYAPEEYRIKFLEELPPETKSQIPDAVKAQLKAIAPEIEKQKTAEALQALIYNAAKQSNIPAKEIFKSLYLIILGKPQGPKIGSLIMAIGKKKTAERLNSL